ncbi:MAG: glutamine-hydrolyzing carbamoyl-phosphate synthase small subunit [Microscillaceae bacterium]|nr:glutamine-hydrolyzing carbamoyl-phosphate synthase small subunit [Microscillaceae bacterium]MDW8461872.1 glutamine-hydrolyzing carbamoyl-phosphate synthase small subunit [Cytophagales bacterium]
MTQPNAILLLADGTYFQGKAIGTIGTTTGEMCFNTGMTGYQEIYTDPSYFGQIVVNTVAHVGNYGTIDSDNESSSAKIAGLVTHEFAYNYSRKTARESLQAFLERQQVVGITGIDTRRLVKHLRTHGAMNGIISSEIFDIEMLKKRLSEAPNMNGLELASKVSTQKPYFVGNPQATFRVAVLDLGIKQNILRHITQRDCYCQVFPAKTSFEEMQQFAPHGYLISNGPGDPASMHYAIATVKKILQHDIPLFGICLGQQILALAVGLSTYKLHYGHRGLNHPVKNLITGRCEITSQNHGFGVSEKDLQAHPEVIATHINLNDNTIEGIRLKNKKAFSVQYHPEASPGPHDSHYLFDEFIQMLVPQ